MPQIILSRYNNQNLIAQVVTHFTFECRMMVKGAFEAKHQEIPAYP
jgi:hypothetical protein